jgi:hypothetical protein
MLFSVPEGAGGNPKKYPDLGENRGVQKGFFIARKKKGTKPPGGETPENDAF